MFPIADSDVSGELVGIVLGALAIFYMIVTKAMAHDRDIKRMKLEADLKIKLAEKLDDPEAIERIANLNVLRGEKPGDAQLKIVKEHQKLALEKARRHAASSQPRIGRYVLPGLICLLLGVGFVIADGSTPDARGLVIPGCILGAIGLALLSYAVFLQDMAKKSYERENSEPRFERVR